LLEDDNGKEVSDLKKLVLGIALVAMITFSVYAQQFCFESDFEVKPVYDGRSLKIVRYLGNNRDVRIPPRVGNLPVTHIGENAFAGLRWVDGELVVGHQLTSVIIPDSVTSIGDWAFASNQLLNATISGNTVYIGMGAFDRNQLTSLIIPNSVTSIGAWAFNQNQLISLTIGNAVTYIGANEFNQNYLASLIIPNNVTYIGDGAFSRNRLTSIIIPDSVTIIGARAFDENQLTNVTIGNNVTIDLLGRPNLYADLFRGYDRFITFLRFYTNNGRRVGTYTFGNGRWSFQPR